MNLTGPLVIFDGVCNYCNSMVNFAIRNDKKGILKFTPFQGETTDKLREQFGIGADIDSVLLIDKGKLYSGSTAAIRIARYLNWPARALYAFIIIPAFIRNPFYAWVARNRYKWFGKKESCMVPSAEVRQRFLP
ncbi:MAG: thiol-disulfide oxidoreductase DCC family protein [Chitinophagaceae bacterium]|nr:thiol-disulfide oxidoreductase DCC family protein [Chitinophagaceae bacterium]